MAWLNGDEALMTQGSPLPDARVAALINLLQADQEQEITHP